MKQLRSVVWLLVALLVVVSLACSVGELLVRSPKPTREPTRTPRPTFTKTPFLTPTPFPTLTPTFTPVEPTATDTPVPPTAPPSEAPAPEDTPTPRPRPTKPPATPTPAEPTETPAPQYPFTVTPYTFNTGSAVETRVTAYVVEIFDASSGQFQDLYGYQFVLVDPQGVEHMSNVSGGKNHTTGEGLGDDRWMNMEAKIAPYTPGHYKAWLVLDGVQQSPVIEFDLAAQPFQYVHLDFFKQH